MKKFSLKGGGRLNSIHLDQSVLPLYFLIASIILNPWNQYILLSFRANDLMLLGSIFSLVIVSRVNKEIFFGYCFFMAAIVFSILIASFSWHSADSERLVFLYKYTLIFFIPIITLSCIKNFRQLGFICHALFISFLFMICWVYYYVFSVGSGVIIGVSRVSFPGSDDFLTSDAHLYSNYLAISLLFYLFYYRIKGNHGLIISSFVCLTCLGALILTGSRNGLLLLILGIFLRLGLLPFSGKKVRLSKSKLAIFLILSTATMFLGFRIWIEFSDFFSDAADRALNFDFTNDLSTQGRIAKIYLAFSDIERTSLLFGASIFRSSLTWYDNGLSIVLVHSGILGIMLILSSLLLIFAKFLKNIRSSEYQAAFCLLSVYSISNVITEFALVTRSALPVIIYITVPVVHSKLLSRYVEVRK